MWRTASDIGGTFTDLAGIDPASGRIVCEKVLTVPSAPAQGVVHGMDLLMHGCGVDYDEVSACIHGSTLVANTLIQRTGARTALVTDAGFIDVLETGVENRYDLFDLHIERPPPLVERHLRFGIRARVGADGEIIQPVDPDAVRAIAGRLKQAGVQSIAICLLHAYRYPAHEEEVAAILAQELPGIPITRSAEVAPEIRETYRASTAVANAYVAPLASIYLADLARALSERGMRAPLSVMLSEGGIATLATASAAPMRLVESGPAGGAMAAAALARRLGISHALAFDMGGTTAKITILDGGEPQRAYRTEVARHRRFRRGSGLPLSVPTIELIEIGAGGGSIARIDRTGLLAVGPQSAGAAPGPACYGAGGDLPTVTDADLVTGILGEDTRLGGRMTLDTLAAKRAILRHIGEPLGLTVGAAAAAVQRVVEENMALAARIHAVEHGYDPSRFTLIAYGGAGPAHAWRVAQILRLSRFIVPMGAGVMSAIGMLIAPPSIELARSYAGDIRTLELAKMDLLLGELEGDARRVLADSSLAVTHVRVRRAVECRYRGQSYEVQVPLPDGPLVQVGADSIVSAFEGHYRALYGRTLPGGLVEALTWRVLAEGPAYEGSLRVEGRADGFSSLAVSDRMRHVHLSDQGTLSVPVVLRDALAPSQRFSGPLLVEAPEATAFIGPGASVTIDHDLNLVVDMKQSAKAASASSCSSDVPRRNSDEPQAHST